MRRLWLLALLCALPIAAQTTTTYTGTIKDLTGTAVTSGRVSFTLKPPGVSNITGIGSFVGNTVSCLINSSGQPVSSSDGTSPCTVVNNTALSPTGTYYNVCIQPYNVTPGSCLNVFAIGGTVDITTLVPTPATQPSFGQGLPGPTGPQGPMGCVVGQTCATVMPIAGGAFTGTVTGPLINGVVGASAYSAATVSAPSLAAGVQAFTAGQEGSPGGSVSAGTYCAEVTYNGASSGETTPSAPSCVTASANSALYAAANDAPAGASSYNVYWQTGGSGNFYEGHTGIAFGVQDGQFTNPPTSGTTPPGSNTATGILAAAQAALGGNPGAIAVPYGVSGNPGDPAIGQTIFDYGTGSILSRFAIPSPQKGMTGSVQNYGYYQDFVLPTLASTGQEVNGFGISIEQGSGCSYGFGLPPFGASVGEFVRNYRCGTSPNVVWGRNHLTYIQNQNANAYIAEDVIYNSSSSAATSDTGGTGYNILSEGNYPAFNGINIGGAQKWANGIVLDANEFTNTALLIGAGNTYGIYSQSPMYSVAPQTATSGANYSAPGMYWQSSIWTTAPCNDIFEIIPTYGTGANPYRVLNFGIAAGCGTGPASFQFNGAPVVAEAGLVVGGSNPAIRTNTASNTDLAGQLTLSGGSASFTFAGTYTSAPICTATDTTSAAAVKIAVTTTTLTLTGTGTDVVNYICVGRN